MEVHSAEHDPTTPDVHPIITMFDFSAAQEALHC